MSTPTLLGLPPELRNRIWELAVVDDLPIQAHQMTTPGIWAQRSERTLPQQPAITQVDHQNRSETLPIFYGQNVFWIPHKTSGVNDMTATSWWESFTNESAQKYVNHIIYTLYDTLLFSNATSEYVEISIRVTKQAGTRFEIEESSRNICLCAAKMRFDAAAAGSIANAITVLEESIAPQVFRMMICQRTKILQMYGRGSEHKAVCPNCGRLETGGRF
ncbi:hypothetical protein LTR10_002689 [Elasticomyces elasticus]|nr:hypothetical protein LTR10_002689 [Elasticomyces elasticus]KAK4967968.1 hypothetical protein LTR42_010296 [Elasticomyces elasticus]